MIYSSLSNQKNLMLAVIFLNSRFLLHLIAFLNPYSVVNFDHLTAYISYCTPLYRTHYESNKMFSV